MASNPFLVTQILADAKQKALDNTSNEKKAKIDNLSGEDIRAIEAARMDRSGSSLTQAGTYADDLRTMSGPQLIEKYGVGVVNDFVRGSNASQELARDRNAYRTNTEATIDTAIGIPTGFVNSVGGIGALGAGLVSDTAGRYASDALQGFNEWTQSGQSDALNRRRSVNQILTEIRKADNKQQAENEVAEGSSSFMAGLRRIGRDAYDSASLTFDDSAIAADVVSQGLGSLLGGGPILKGTSLVGKGVARLAGRQSLSRGGRRITEAAGVGLMEAGGAYQQTFQEAYDRIKDRTDLTEDQKNDMANSAALEAAGIQGTIATGIGFIPGATALERSPLSLARSARGNAARILGETLEEGVQSGTGQLSQNIAIRDQIDPEQDILEGVGSEAAVGAIGGLGSSAVVQAPSVAINTALAPIRAIGARGEKVRKEADRETIAQTEADITELREAGPIDVDAANTSLDSAEIDPEIRDTARREIDELARVSQYDPEDASYFSEELQGALNGSQDKFEALTRALDIASNEELPMSQRIEAAAYANEIATQGKQAVRNNLMAAISAIDDNDVELGKLRAYEDIFLNLDSHPVVRQVAEILNKEVQNITPEQVNAEALQTPEGIQRANAVISAGAVNPDAVSMNVVNALLEQTEDDSPLDPRQRRTVEVIKSYKDGQERLKKSAKKAGIKNTDRVHEEIISSPFESGHIDEDSRNPLRLSLKQHYQLIMQAGLRGDMDALAASMDNLGWFAAHMQNKLATVNEAIEKNAWREANAVPYMAVVPARNPAQRRWVPSNIRIWSNPRAADSVRLAKRIAEEATTVTDFYNKLVNLNNEMGLPLIPVGSLNSAYDGEIADVVKRAKAEAKKAPAAREQAGQNETSPEPSETVTTEAPQPSERESDADRLAQRRERWAERARSLTDEALNDALNKAQIGTMAFEVLDEELTRREDEWANADLRPGFQEETEDVSSLESETEIEAESNTDQITQPTEVVEESPIIDEETRQMEEENQEDRLERRIQDLDAEGTTDETETTPETTPRDSTPVSSERSAEAQEEREATPREPKTVSEAYPSLIQRNGTNWFQRVYKAVFGRSKIALSDNPLATLRDMLVDKESIEEFTGQKALGYNTKAANAYNAMLRRVPSIRKDINARLLGVMKKKPDLFTHAGMLTSRRGRVLNITEEHNGSLRYNPAIMDKAIIAGIQWMVNGLQTNYSYDSDEIAKELSIDPSDVTNRIELIYNNTISSTEGKRSLANMIGQYLGVTKDKNQPTGLTDGILEAIAAEVIYGLEGADLVSRFAWSVAEDKKLSSIAFKPIPGVIESDASSMVDQIKQGMVLYPDAINMVVLNEKQNPVSIGSKLNRKATHRLRVPDALLSRQEKAMVKKIEDIPLYPESWMAGIYKALGKNGAIQLFANGFLDETEMHPKDYESKNGQNIAINAAFEAFEEYMAALEAYAEDSGELLPDIPVYFGSEVISTGRLMMVGKQNPVLSKFMREFLLPTKETVDLNDPEMNNMFFLALAQAMGVKLDKMTPSEAIEEGKRRLADPRYEEALEIIEEAQETAEELSRSDIEILKEAMGNPSPVMLHALSDYARYVRAKESGNLGKFTTSIYLESDGRTNGPAGALFMYGMNPFSKGLLNRFNKVGAFVGSEAVIGDDPQISGQKPVDDLYVTTSGIHTSNLNWFLNSFEGKFRNHIANGLDLLRFADVGLTRTENGYESTRNAIKNPLTQWIYGAGITSISKGIANSVLDAYYALSTRAMTHNVDMEEFNHISNLMDQMTSNRLVYSSKVDKWFLIDYKRRDDWKGSKRGTAREFTKMERDNLNHNIKVMYGQPLESSIKKVMGPILQSTGLLVEVSQVHNDIYQRLFQDALDKALKAKKKELGKAWASNLFLSENELTKVRDSVEWARPRIDGDGQYLDFATMSEGIVTDKNTPIRFSSDIEDGFITPANIQTPGDIGVRALALATQNFGDARMVLRALNMGVDKLLAVYDGMHMSLSRIKEDGPIYNKAIKEAWTYNFMGAYAEQFNNFLNHLAEDQQWTELETNFGSDMDALRQMGMSLQTTADQIGANMEAIKAAPMAMDQMAGAGTPDTQNLTNIPSDQDATVTLLNQKRNEVLDRLEPENVTAHQLPSRLKKLATTHKSGVSILRADTLIQHIDELTPDKNIQNLVKSLFNNMAQEWRIIFGPPKARAIYAPDLMEQTKSNTRGITDPIGQRIFLNSQTMETIVHELVHAATFATVYNVLNGTNASSEQDMAVYRIEQLMNQFVNMDYDTSNWSDKARQAYNSLRNAVNNALADPDPIMGSAKAINEFMAWTLTNKDLSFIAANTKADPEIVKWTQRAWRAIQKLFQTMKFWEPKNDILSNLRFNTEILTTETDMPSLGEIANKVSLFQEESFGSNDRLSTLQNALNTKLAIINKTLEGQDKIERMEEVGRESAREFSIAFPMTLQETHAFGMFVSAMTVNTGLDGNTFRALGDTYKHVIDNLSVSDFLADPETNNPAELYRAQLKYAAVVGNTTGKAGVENISTRIPAFLALALTNDEFRTILRNIKPPKDGSWDKSSIDSYLNSFGSKMMDGLGRYTAGVGRPTDALDAADKISRRFVENLSKQENVIDLLSEKGHGALAKANDWVVAQKDAIANKVGDRLIAVVTNKDSTRLTKLAANIGRTIAAAVNEDQAELLAEGGMAALNRHNVWKFVRSAYSDLLGRTKSNASVYDLIKLTKKMVTIGRENYREQLPKNIRAKFSKELSKGVWTNLFRGVAKTDIVSLRSMMSEQELVDTLGSDKKINEHITSLENKIKAQPNSKLVLDKAAQLANWMNTGDYGSFFLGNAYAVANLLGMRVANHKASDALVQDVDNLVSLYAFRDQDAAQKESIRELLINEKGGMTHLFASLQGTRKDEMTKTVGRAKFNGYKGHIVSEARKGVNMRVVSDNQRGRLELLGYTRMGDYKGSSLLPSRRKGYYYSPVNGASPFTQGIAQTVNETASGVDPRTGFSTGSTFVEIIADKQTVGLLLSRRRDVDLNNENLRPVFGDKGDVIAFERTIDPKMDALLERNTDLSEMLGAWRGRQYEEANAMIANSVLLGSLKDMYDKRDNDADNEYINILDKNEWAKDPVLEDAVRLLSPRMLEEAQKVFGQEDFLPVRKDMLDDVTGYRHASVGDWWTGQTRLNDKTYKALANITMGIFGKNSYKYMINSERLLERAMGEVRTTIVVRSVIVPLGNMMSNLNQMLMRGVPLKKLVSDVPKKISEIQSYVGLRKEHIFWEGELLAAEGRNNTGDINRAKARLKIIEDQQRALSIWPLIDNGEFSAIAEDLDKQDFPTTGNWSEWIEKKVSKYKDNDLVRYAYVTQDTPLFKFLQTSVNYGDFISKAIMFDHLQSRKGKTQAEALAQITDEFINYDKVRGRLRQKLENMGLLWFWNFKLRAVKVAASMLRNDPVHVLFYGMMPVPDVISGFLDSPLTDNIVTQSLDGSLKYSIGPGMAESGHALNPWIQLKDSLM